MPRLGGIVSERVLVKSGECPLLHEYVKENIPTEKPKTFPSPWILEADEYQRWPGDYYASAPSGTEKAYHGLVFLLKEDMLKKALRLKTNEDFTRVFRQGTPLFFGAIGCKIVPTTLGNIRVGFSFSKKHLSKAVSRNRLRRVLVEPFSRNTTVIGRELSRDIVFFTVQKIEAGNFKAFASIAENVVKYITSIPPRAGKRSGMKACLPSAR